MSRSLLLFLCLLPMIAFGREAALCQRCTSNMALQPALTLRLAPDLGFSLGTNEYSRRENQYTQSYEQSRQRRNRWLLVTGGVLAVGTTTLLVGVRLFNNGNNAKKNALGDQLINIGLGVDLLAVLPLVLGVRYHLKARALTRDYYRNNYAELPATPAGS